MGKLRECKETLQKHLNILRECEKSKSGDNAPCWNEVKKTNQRVMRDYKRCRDLEKSCSKKSLLAVKNGESGDSFKKQLKRDVGGLTHQFDSKMAQEIPRQIPNNVIHENVPHPQKRQKPHPQNAAKPDSNS